MNGQNFDPYIDYSGVTDEMVEDFHKAALEFDEAKANFMAFKDKKTCGRVLKAHLEISKISSNIHEALYTVPVMVHVAGLKKEEQDEEGHETVIQRCKRCGSMLHFWHEGMGAITPEGPKMLEPEDLPWWDEGDIVAKSTAPGSINMYEIEKGKELDKHEMPCPPLADLAS